MKKKLCLAPFDAGTVAWLGCSVPAHDDDDDGDDDDDDDLA